MQPPLQLLVHPTYEACHTNKTSHRRPIAPSTEQMDVMITGSPNLSDIFSVFFDEGEAQRFGGDVEEGRNADGRDAESNTFWEKQYQLLEEALGRSSPTERRIRADTEDALSGIQSLGAVCRCSGKPMDLCKNCILGGISDRLRDIGYNSALCKSKWRRSTDILSGEHSYVDVVVDTKTGHDRVVIDPSFQAEFEMARASPEYNHLVSLLPEVFVGKSENPRCVIKIVCAAAKKCMKDNKMHLAPWRKHKYMQSKWLGSCQRMPSSAPLLQAAEKKISDRQRKQRASMLTFDLHRTAVEVV